MTRHRQTRMMYFGVRRVPSELMRHASLFIYIQCRERFRTEGILESCTLQHEFVARENVLTLQAIYSLPRNSMGRTDWTTGNIRARRLCERAPETFQHCVCSA